MSRLRGAAGQDGFTLIELLIASTLSLVIIGATMAVFTSLTHRADESARLNDAQDQAHFAISEMAKQLRNLASPTPAQPLSIDSAGAYDLVFQTVDPVGPNSGANKVNVRRVRYCVGSADKTRLYRQTQTWTTSTIPAVPSTTACPGTGWTTTRQVAASLTNTYNGQNRPLFVYNSTDTTAITRIESTLWIDPQPTRPPKEISLTTAVDLRNQNRKPNATFTITQSTGNNVIVNGSDSDDPEQQPLTYAWTADGTKSSCTSIVCTLPLTGSNPHTISLTVADPSTLTGTYQLSYTVPG